MAQLAKRAQTRANDLQSSIQSLLGSQNVVWRSPGELTPYPRNARKHPDHQLHAVMRNITQNGWTNPILTDETGTVLAGHCRLEAAKRLGLDRVPTLTLVGLSEAKKKAIVIADNRLAERAIWDFELLRGEFRSLIDFNVDVDLTGFSSAEVDIVLDGSPKPAQQDPADEFTISDEPAISRLGDLWQLGPHRILCGDALKAESYHQLLDGDRAQMVVTDPPYNVRIYGHARGRGKVFREFAMASGEMSDEQFRKFLATGVEHAIAFSVDGSIHYWCMDWRHLRVLCDAAVPRYQEWKQLLVWNKSNGGQGSFYRSKHELIAVFKNGLAPHVNNFGLGSEGRYRTNVLDYPGGASLSPCRREQQDLHPTVKPVSLVADLMRDCSKRTGIILDSFAGSGTVLLAAERSGRVARAIEIDPLYVDTAIRRWEKLTGKRVVHADTGTSFEETRKRRTEPLPTRRTRKAVGD